MHNAHRSGVSVDILHDHRSDDDEPNVSDRFSRPPARIVARSTRLSSSISGRQLLIGLALFFCGFIFGRLTAGPSSITMSAPAGLASRFFSSSPAASGGDAHHHRHPGTSSMPPNIAAKTQDADDVLALPPVSASSNAVASAAFAAAVNAYIAALDQAAAKLTSSFLVSALGAAFEKALVALKGVQEEAKKSTQPTEQQLNQYLHNLKKVETSIKEASERMYSLSLSPANQHVYSAYLNRLRSGIAERSISVPPRYGGLELDDVGRAALEASQKCWSTGQWTYNTTREYRYPNWWGEEWSIAVEGPQRHVAASRYQWVSNTDEKDCPKQLMDYRDDTHAEGGILSRERVCQLMNGREMLVIGDSLNYQVHDVMYSHLLVESVNHPAPLKYINDQWSCKSHILCDDAPTLYLPFKLTYKRNDDLTLAPNDRIPPGEWLPLLMTYENLIQPDRQSIVVLNRGAHWKPTPVYADELQSTMTALRSRHPETLFLLRPTIWGHYLCMDHTAPLPSLAAAEALVKQAPEKFHWAEFPAQNDEMEKIASRSDVGAVFLQMFSSAALRADGHRTTDDCLHYIAPGSGADHWTFWMLNTLKQAGRIEIAQRFQDIAEAKTQITQARQGTKVR